MATNQVLLLKPIRGLGAEGETVSVRAGYARNFLLPRRMALPITQANKKQVESLRKAREVREANELKQARETADRLAKTHVAIAVKTGEGGKMFGAVTANDLIARLREEGIELTRRELGLPQPIKELGTHSTTVKLHPEVEVELKFDVVSENPIEETGEAGSTEEAASGEEA